MQTLSLAAVPVGTLIGVLSALFLLSILYAILLQFLESRHGFVSDYTWLTVVIGVGYTLVALAVISWVAAVLALVMFGVSCVPIIAWSLINDMRTRNELRDLLQRRGSDDRT
jgi:Na+/melibiose symporter-like transporter